MGSFNNLYAFISNRVLLRTNSDDSDCSKESYHPTNTDYNRNRLHRRSYSESTSTYSPKEAIQRMFPCEERHSFNPHYQHNLHSTFPSYSTPPSLSSSPTNSSPSSTASSASHSMSAAGQKAYYQYTHPRSARQCFQQQQLQQQQKQRQRHHRSFSYSRQQTRRQCQQHYANQQQHLDCMDDDLLIGYDNQQVYYGSGASASMSRVHPNGSPSYSPFSSSFDRHQSEPQQQRPQSHISSTFRASETKRGSPSLPADAAAAAFSLKSSNHIHNGQHILPSISETTASLHMIEDDADDAVDAALESSPMPSTTSASMTAKQSLMRIARCDPRQDNWCSSQSGQWTRHYAETRSSGIVADGRRARRL
ncbi:hypothetical protein BC939DRAFT_506489 [Gamsiella multidivaricata]|uniref:uncharacterized protein n=1 Tax=Gamsiella multidivaricata TaxID=101098 RepID=UPI00221FE75B|nr:uncharacterized protein BC939DRAFT_506489 [Gamsiella multidivaricata]KAI7818519.1 hypothetical protein BC939DRAFT_506489 [Gamsiella multidivaricata]